MTACGDSCSANGALVRRGRRLEYLTVGWNVAEAAIAMSAGILAGSTALIGFGLDSLIESLSGSIMLWRLQEGEAGERRERLALRLIGVSFLLLAAYVTFEAAQAIVLREPPDASPVGIGLAIVSVVVMPLLARAKRRVATGLNSGALHADSRQTDICAWLSAILLVGLVLNASIGWWWADPLAALLMVPIIGKEGIDALRGKSCGCND